MKKLRVWITRSEQMESDHRHAGYKPAALPLSYVPGCPDLSTTRDQDGGIHHILYAEDTYEKRKLNVLDISNSFMIHIIILNRNIRNIRNKL